MAHVLRIIARMNVGGPARHVLRIAAPLAERGWTSTLVTGRPGAGEGDLVSEARGAGLEVIELPTLGRELHPWRDARALAALRGVIRRRRPDLIHTHTAKAGVLGRTAALSLSELALPKRPVLVHTFHGHVLSGYFSGPVSAAFAAIERRLAKRTDRMVAVSAAVRDELLRHHGVGRPEQYRIVPPGFDRARTRPDAQAGAALRRELGLSPGDVLFGAVGRLAPVKNVELLAAVWARLAPGSSARLLIVGDGPSGPALRRRLAALPAAARGAVHLLAARDDLGAVYGALDALLLPSHREGLPQVVAEALAAGVPVLGRAVGGVPELIRDGRDGVLLADGGPAAWTAAVESLAADPGRLAVLAEGAAERARDGAWERHGAESVAEALAQIYEEACLSGPAGARHAARSCTWSS